MGNVVADLPQVRFKNYDGSIRRLCMCRILETIFGLK